MAGMAMKAGRSPREGSSTSSPILARPGQQANWGQKGRGAWAACAGWQGESRAARRGRGRCGCGVHRQVAAALQPIRPLRCRTPGRCAAGAGAPEMVRVLASTLPSGLVMVHLARESSSLEHRSSRPPAPSYTSFFSKNPSWLTILHGSALLCFSRQGRGGAGCRKGMRCSCIPRPSTTQRTGRPACRRGGRTGSAS